MRIGAHLDNLDEPAEASYHRLALMRAEIVGTMWTDGTKHRRPVYDRLEQTLNEPHYCVRVGPSGRISPTGWARQARAALAELPPAAVEAGRVRIRALNEVNLPAEGGWTPEAYAEFLVCARRAAKLPAHVPLVAAPISLGLPDWRDWWERFVGACGGLVPAARLAVNCYAHLVGEAAFFADYSRPVDVTEIGTLGLPPGPARATWLLERCRDLAAAGVESVQAFIVGGRSNGAWDERYILTEDECAALGARDVSLPGASRAGSLETCHLAEVLLSCHPEGAPATEGSAPSSGSRILRCAQDDMSGAPAFDPTSAATHDPDLTAAAEPGGTASVGPVGRTDQPAEGDKPLPYGSHAVEPAGSGRARFPTSDERPVTSCKAGARPPPPVRPSSAVVRVGGAAALGPSCLPAAAGSPASDAATGAPAERTASLMTGKGAFIWYLEAAERGDLAAIAARARAADLRFVLVKCGDGGATWRQLTREVVATLQAEGLQVFGWAYCYGEDVDAELAVARTCFEIGADGYVADVEAEYEGRWREAERFAAGLAELRPPGKLIGYSPLPVIDYHQSLPYAQLNRVADVVMPQLYCRLLGSPWTPDALWEQWRRWSGLWREWGIQVPRIVPIAEACGDATGEDLAALAAASRTQGAPDLAIWEWSHARDEHWHALAALP